MDYEGAVAEYLCAWGRAFIAPQFSVAHDPVSKTGGSSPDFVVIDFKNRDVAVVEVTASGSNTLGGLIDRIRERETRWYQPIRRQLVADEVIPDDWPIRTIAFIQKEWVLQQDGSDGWAERQIMEAGIVPNDVTFVAIEDATFPYKWFEQRKLGLPDRARQQSQPV